MAATPTVRVSTLKHRSFRCVDNLDEMGAKMPVVTPPWPGIHQRIRGMDDVEAGDSAAGSAAAPGVKRGIIRIAFLCLHAYGLELPQAGLADLLEHLCGGAGLFEGGAGLAEGRCRDGERLLPGLEDGRLAAFALAQTLQLGSGHFEHFDRVMPGVSAGPEACESLAGFLHGQGRRGVGLGQRLQRALMGFQCPQCRGELPLAPFAQGEGAIERVLGGELEGAFVQRG